MITMPAERYKLTVNLSITKEIRYGDHDSHWSPTQERLSINEDVDLGALDFLGVMGVLGKLHEAVGQVRPAA
jgi:hypothetical protein